MEGSFLFVYLCFVLFCIQSLCPSMRNICKFGDIFEIINIFLISFVIPYFLSLKVYFFRANMEDDLMSNSGSNYRFT